MGERSEVRILHLKSTAAFQNCFIFASTPASFVASVQKKMLPTLSILNKEEIHTFTFTVASFDVEKVRLLSVESVEKVRLASIIRKQSCEQSALLPPPPIKPYHTIHTKPYQTILYHTMPY